jgi:transcriptional regulator with XRE-family HTH domain
MLQKPEDITKDQFLKDVESLSLRFPVARISQETGFNKSSVSKYLNGSQEPSVNFLKAFYKWFNESGKKVSHENAVNEDAVDYVTPEVKTEQDVVQAASIKVLYNELAKLKAKMYNMPVKDCLEELKQNTSLIIEDILRELKTK